MLLYFLPSSFLLPLSTFCFEIFTFSDMYSFYLLFNCVCTCFRSWLLLFCNFQICLRDRSNHGHFVYDNPECTCFPTLLAVQNQRPSPPNSSFRLLSFLTTAVPPAALAIPYRRHHRHRRFRPKLHGYRLYYVGHVLPSV